MDRGLPSASGLRGIADSTGLATSLLYTSTGGGDTMAINLTLVADRSEQVENNSTWFDVEDPVMAARLTVEFTIYDDEGNELDCAVYGPNPEYFDCQFVWL